MVVFLCFSQLFLLDEAELHYYFNKCCMLIGCTKRHGKDRNHFRAVRVRENNGMQTTRTKPACDEIGFCNHTSAPA